jgi:hypothetical protein
MGGHYLLVDQLVLGALWTALGVGLIQVFVDEKRMERARLKRLAGRRMPS